MVVVSVMIREDHRRLGLGRRLIQKAIAVATTHSYEKLVVPLEAGNEGGAGFLTQCGLENQGPQAPFFNDGDEGGLWQIALPQQEPE